MSPVCDTDWVYSEGTLALWSDGACAEVAGREKKAKALWSVVILSRCQVEGRVNGDECTVHLTKHE